jgi:hypothetical protein
MTYTLGEIIEQIENSTRDEWEYIACWGANSGNSFHEGHQHVAIFATDIRIQIAWGYLGHAMDDERETKPWSENLSDPRVTEFYIDFFFNNSLFYRIVGASIDGGRCIIPQVQSEVIEENGTQHVIYWIPSHHFKFFRLLSNMELRRDFDRYIEWLTEIEVRGNENGSLLDELIYDH